jgi:hypothetical protein
MQQVKYLLTGSLLSKNPNNPIKRGCPEGSLFFYAGWVLNVIFAAWPKQ